MEIETVNKLFLELSQFATATTAKEVKLKELLVAAKNELLHSNRYYENREKTDLLIKIQDAI